MTLVGEQKYVYERVNLGFTVQSGDVLYLVVVRGADALDDWDFVQALGGLQRRAIGKKLRPEESQGATLSFSSMARWQVRRHVPVLPPHSSLIVAHTAAVAADVAVLGATYDHRVLSGFEVANALTILSRPPGD
jgi:pyruvate/2-oxoglutarate dehydrogenase complex dihydrolipoamide acyltransferase (E2) component